MPVEILRRMWEDNVGMYIEEVAGKQLSITANENIDINYVESSNYVTRFLVD